MVAPPASSRRTISGSSGGAGPRTAGRGRRRRALTVLAFREFRGLRPQSARNDQGGAGKE